MLDQVKNLLSEKSSLESELRVCESVTQQWMTNQVHATLAPNTCKQTPASTSIWGSSVLIPDWFRIRGTSKMTPGPSGSCGFSVRSCNVLTDKGYQTFDNVAAILLPLEWHLELAIQAMGWVGTTRWGEQAVLQPTGNTAVWAMHLSPMSTPIKWFPICAELKVKYNASNILDLVKRELEELSLKKGEPITEYNES